ncbi:hypothetical protein NLG97_g3258 [Lecanicillium saksenae]|uniref:Uncharacterized protein n=1 Tax=Lecanicillium saksenae TaxID=468837 RepID=A0ACC1R0C9_9HYPO|nr:hypothetical protein NLG97_g3258 [Lecanicillium saksenae]
MEHRTFHPFTELPPEIRARIWRHAVQPRIVPITCWVGDKLAEYVSHAIAGEKWEQDLAKYRNDAKTRLPLDLYAKAPPKPAVMDVCRETRSLGLYEKMILTPGSDASYAWVNYDADIIYLKTHDEPYTRLKNCGSRVRRLQIKVDVTDEFWDRNRSHGLRTTFTQLDECFVLMRGDGRIWYWRARECRDLIACAPENVHLIEPRTDERMTLAELRRLTDTEIHEWVERTEIDDTSSSEDDDSDW